MLFVVATKRTNNWATTEAAKTTISKTTFMLMQLSLTCQNSPCDTSTFNEANDFFFLLLLLLSSPMRQRKKSLFRLPEKFDITTLPYMKRILISSVGYLIVAQEFKGSIFSTKTKTNWNILPVTFFFLSFSFALSLTDRC